MGVTRAFAAIGLPEDARGALLRLTDRLRGGRRVDEENLHLTLVFLGELAEPELEEVHDAFGAVRCPGFSLRVTGLDCFGGARPRALWAGVEGEPALDHLQGKLAQAARAAGVEVPGRRFVPHVTLAQFKESAGPPAGLAEVLTAHAGVRLAPFPVRGFGLYASHLTSDGAVYEELAAYPLVAGS